MTGWSTPTAPTSLNDQPSGSFAQSSTMRYVKSPVPTMIAISGPLPMCRAQVNEATGTKQSPRRQALILTSVLHPAIESALLSHSSRSTPYRGRAMRRRDFLILTAGVAGGRPTLSRAQQKAMPVIGYLNSTSPDPNEPFAAAFRQGLSEAGLGRGTKRGDRIPLGGRQLRSIAGIGCRPRRPPC